jgi:multiple sugar transport system substrate-binding protein
MFKNERKVSRRKFLRGAAGGAAALAALSHGIPIWAADKINLDFCVWSYGVETVLDNIDKFEQRNPGISVELNDFPWPKYHSTMVNRFRTHSPTDVLYAGSDVMHQWAFAGWFVPLEDYFPEITDYKEELVNFAISEMTHKGKLYGLPYFSDVIVFMYNEKILEDHGFNDPPTNWEDVKEYSLALKEAGIDKPIIYEAAEDLPNFLSAFWSMVYGRGERPFDDNLNPIFNDPNHAVYKQLQWYADSLNKWKIATYLPHETKVAPAMGTGKHVFSVMYHYMLAQLNNPDANPLAGQFKLALMPGEAHRCFGFANMYCMTQMAAERGREVRDAVWKFIQYFGGKTDGVYKVAKRWALEKGLGFAQLPLYDDPEIRNS